MSWTDPEPPYVIPAAPGWRAAYSEAQGLPDDEPLDDHVWCSPIVAWEVRSDERGRRLLQPMVSEGTVVAAAGNEPDWILAPGEEPEDHRSPLTWDREAARERIRRVREAEQLAGEEPPAA